ncbi:DsbA family protein [Erythrobacter sp. JK5]|uniref:DsbA family protein n=1 Tax=Erythrobacter sp. JK5 TaxID=2829500 RepID=UPI001BA685E5|nr:DsbA family protein [Erythrobacter sp. JK5]QUL37210.1 DsbA family protein [Erythrobacter sp. JK5]
MKSTLPTTFATALMALVFGFLGAALWSYSGLADNRTRTFLLDNPDMLPQMAQAYQQQEAGKRLASIGNDVYAPFEGVILGNPQGGTVLVEFTDYNCPYCEASLADVDRLVADNPDLKVVVREWPIFEGSDVAARMALAAGMQGKYEAFHAAMFENGPVTPESVERAARAAGLDLDRARTDAASDAVTVELARNATLAQSLGFGGTPAWVTSDAAFEGAVGFEGLKSALEGSGPQTGG